ncbi:MAG: hypothetical protein ACE5SW_13020 [Nitrososphaeraceae archaeon]
MSHSEKKLPNSEDKPNKIKDYGIPLAVMAASLIAVYILWATFGYIGPTFSDNVLKEQQATLREKYNMPPAEEITGAENEIPPSMRELVKNNSSG